MDFEELKDIIKNLDVTEYKPTDSKKELVGELNGHYHLPNSKQPFEGKVIELSGEEFNAYYQRFCNGSPEYKFRERLESMDNWFYDKPYKVQEKWPYYVAKWLKGE